MYFLGKCGHCHHNVRIFALFDTQPRVVDIYSAFNMLLCCQGAPMRPRIYRFLRHSVWLRGVMLGVCAVLALPPLHVLPAAVVAFTGVFWLFNQQQTMKKIVLAAWGFGVGFFGAGLYWVTLSMLVEPEKYAWMIPFAVLLLGGGLGLFMAVHGWLYGVVRKRCAAPLLLWLAFATIWGVLEWVRNWFLTGFPWNPLASVWMPFDAPLQGVSVFGSFGMGIISCLIFTLPLPLGQGVRGVGRAVAAPIAVLLLLVGYGAVRLADAPAVGQAATHVHMRLVQPNVSQAEKWDADKRVPMLQAMVAQSTQAATTVPDLIIWPETALTFDILRNTNLRRQLGRTLAARQYLITGALAMQWGAPQPSDRGLVQPLEKLQNSLFVLDHAGDIVHQYDKVHLVPFGEYVPLKDVLPIAKITHGRTDFTPGDRLQSVVLDAHIPAFSPLICYEIIFPGAAMPAFSDSVVRPQWILTITNDAWFGQSAGPYQHFATARLRALEEGVPVVRVANTGISGVIDGYGRVWQKTALMQAAVLDSPLPQPVDGDTLVVQMRQWCDGVLPGRVGSFPLLVLLGVIVAAGGYRIVRKGAQAVA
jgi:apolipoprotein N-acyltransferase